jgi:predicted DNA-binding transcriptional regulator YafY
MANTATRLITLMMLLQRRPSQKAAELGAQLGVSVRTVQRYIAMLDEMGIPIYAERGPYGGYSLVRGFRMPPLVLAPEEAVAITLGTSLVSEMWGELYRDAAQGALAKLDNLLPDEQRQEVAWARRTLLVSHMHRADQAPLGPFLEKLRRAIREHRRVRMTYRARSQPEPLQRDVDPYALVHRWGWWYGIGHCHLRDAIRSFRVDRIVELMLLDLTFVLPSDLDLQHYLATEPHVQPRIQVRMRFQPEVALLAWDDRSMWNDLQEQSDGSIVVTYVVPSLDWAARTALSYGQFVVVLEPEELCQLVAERARAIAAQYASKNNG